VAEAIQQQADVVLLVVAPSLLTSDFAYNLVRAQRRDGTPCFEVSAEVFESIAFRGEQHGVTASLARYAVFRQR
jgi:hypothetical protein